MSKDRRRRRAEREATASTAGPGQRKSAPRAAAASRPSARPGRGRSVGRKRRPRRTGLLAAERRKQNLWLAAGLVLANALLWTQLPSWPARIVALVLTIALWPVIVTIAFDRRSS